MILTLIVFFFILTISLAILVRDHLEKNSTLILILMSLSCTITSSLFVVVQVSQAKEPLKAVASMGAFSNMLVAFNGILLLSSFLIWFFTKSNVKKDRTNFLVELVGAWNKVDIDNSTDILVDHGLRNPMDRSFVIDTLKIIKGYKEENSKLPVIETTPKEGLSK